MKTYVFFFRNTIDGFNRKLDTGKRISELNYLQNYPEYSTGVKEGGKFQM